jgi:hypothetical protein
LCCSHECFPHCQGTAGKKQYFLKKPSSKWAP